MLFGDPQVYPPFGIYGLPPGIETEGSGTRMELTAEEELGSSKHCSTDILTKTMDEAGERLQGDAVDSLGLAADWMSSVFQASKKSRTKPTTEKSKKKGNKV